MRIVVMPIVYLTAAVLTAACSTQQAASTIPTQQPTQEGYTGPAPQPIVKIETRTTETRELNRVIPTEEGIQQQSGQMGTAPEPETTNIAAPHWCRRGARDRRGQCKDTTQAGHNSQQRSRRHRRIATRRRDPTEACGHRKGSTRETIGRTGSLSL